MAENEQKNRAARRTEERQQEREQALQAQQERDTETLVNTTPSPVTAVDGLGVERIITTVDGTYKTAQTDPDPKEVERLEKLNSQLDAKKAERLDAMSATTEGGKVAQDAIKAEEKAPGAGTPTATTPAAKAKA